MSWHANVSRSLGLVTIAVAATLVIVACAASAAPAPTQAPAKPADKPAGAPTAAPKPAVVEVKAVRLTATAGPATSVTYAYWVGITKAIKKVYPQLDVTIVEASGGLDIAKRVRAGRADFGNATSDLMYANFYGEGEFKDQPNKNVRLLWYYEIQPFQWAVSKASGIKTLAELNGKKFNPGSAGSATAAATRKIFNDFDIRPDYFEGVAAAASDAMMNRQIVGVSKGGPVPDSYLRQIHATLPIYLLGLTKDQQEKAIAKYPYLPLTVPAKAYGDSDEVLTVGNTMGGVTTSAMPQEVGYAIFKAMWEGGKDEWQAAHPQAAKNNVPEMTLKSQTPLHAGSVQYLKEKGFKVPDNLIPPEYRPVQ